MRNGRRSAVRRVPGIYGEQPDYGDCKGDQTEPAYLGHTQDEGQPDQNYAFHRPSDAYPRTVQLHWHGNRQEHHRDAQGKQAVCRLLPVTQDYAIPQQAVEQGQQQGETAHPVPELVEHQLVADAEIGRRSEQHQSLVGGPRRPPPQEVEQRGGPYEYPEYDRGAHHGQQKTRLKFLQPKLEQDYRPDQSEQSEPAPVAESGQRQHSQVQHQDVGQQEPLVGQPVRQQ